VSQVPLGVPRRVEIPTLFLLYTHRDRVYHERKGLAEMFKNGAKVYLCGSGRMASGVKETCARIYADYKEVELEEGREWMKAVQAERFATDIFG
jgi:cytochrome P450/NADPH-cytochrome P450 reductase